MIGQSHFVIKNDNNNDSVHSQSVRHSVTSNLVYVEPTKQADPSTAQFYVAELPFVQSLIHVRRCSLEATTYSE